jgi:phage terminase large subunit-like protein
MPKPTTRKASSPRSSQPRAAQGKKEPKLRSQGHLVAEFIETFCRLTKGEQAGQLIKLRPWQREILDDLFQLRADGRRRYRRGLLGLPRKNGKSLIAAGIALYGLVVDEVGADVFVVAGDRAQARIVFRECARMVELDPILSQRLRVMRDLIEFPATGSVLRVLSADASRAEGLNPSLVVFDEVHVQPDDRLWSTMNLGSGTRSQPLVIGITTAGARFDSRGQDSLCYRLWQYGRQVKAGEIDDPTFYFRWFAAAEDADYRDPKTWAAANPALGDFLFEEDMKSAVLSLPESEVRTKRLNQWVATSTQWLPGGAWDSLISERRIKPGEEIVLAFDGSFSNDSTAIVAATLDGHLETVGLWERRIDDPHYEVPIAEVEDRMRELCRTYQVREIAADPYRWARTLQAWEAEGLPVVIYPQSPGRMVPACATFLEAVTHKLISHPDDQALARHLDNCAVKIDRLGPRIVKEHKGSPRKIDAAVCAVMAYDRARWHATEATKNIDVSLEFI